MDTSTYTDGSVFIGTQLTPNTEIQIAENVFINCRAKYTWWSKFWLKLLLGWKVKKIK